MTWKRTVFERQKLFDEVWEIPMSRLAKTYRLSDVGLRKICVALDIPLPPRGYWARLAAGKTSRKPQLPESSGKTTYEHVWHEAPVDDALNARISYARESTEARMVSTPDYSPPGDAHEFQAQAIHIIKAMRKVKVKDGLLSISEVCWADMSVSDKLLERALLIADRVAYELLTLGAQFENSYPAPPKRGNGTRRDPHQKRNGFSLHGHQFFLRIREKVVTEVIPRELKLHSRASVQAPPPQYRYATTGELQASIVDAARYYERYKIHDSARGAIELKIRKVLVEAEDTTLRWKLARELGAERELQRKANAQNWEQLNETKNKLLTQLAMFETMAKDLERARTLRRFIDEIEANECAPPELQENIALMALMANWLDPLVKAPWPGVDGIGEKNPYGSIW